MVERVGVHLDCFVDAGGAVVGGEVAESFKEALEMWTVISSHLLLPNPLYLKFDDRV